MKRLRQLFTYSGSKFLLALILAIYYPKHRRFVSLFSGSAGEFSAKEPSPVEVYNDLDNQVFDVFQVLQNPKQCEQLLALLENTPNGRQQYEVCRRILDDPPRRHSRVRRVWAFLVCGNVCRGGFHPALTTNWPPAAATDGPTRHLLTLSQRVAQWRERFRRVRLEHADWYWVFKKYDRSDTLFYVDPPYHPGTLKSAGRLYQHELTIKMHVKLLRALNGAKGRVVLSGYNHPLYTAYLFHWRKVELPRRSHMGGKADSRCEVIWINVEEDGKKISRNKLLIARRYVEVMGGVCTARRYLGRVMALLALPKPSSPSEPAPRKRQTWLNYTDDGRGLPSTRMLIAKRYCEIMGCASTAQRWLDRIEKLMEVPK